MQISATSSPDLEVTAEPAVSNHAAASAAGKSEETGIHSVLDIRPLRQLVLSSFHAASSWGTETRDYLSLAL